MSPIASDLSYEVLQRRTRQRELTTPRLNQSLGLPQLFHQQPVIRFWDAGEGQLAFDTSDAAVPNPARIAVGEAE